MDGHLLKEHENASVGVSKGLIWAPRAVFSVKNRCKSLSGPGLLQACAYRGTSLIRNGAGGDGGAAIARLADSAPHRKSRAAQAQTAPAGDALSPGDLFLQSIP